MTNPVRYIRVNVTFGSQNSSTMVTQGLYEKRGFKKLLAWLMQLPLMEWRNLESPTHFTLDIPDFAKGGMIEPHPLTNPETCKDQRS